MMKIVNRTTVFDRDIKRQKKRGKDLTKLIKVVELIASGKKLEKKYCAHKLLGNYSGSWECHVEPDWLLIYQISYEDLTLQRTGSHADLFK